MRPTRAAVYDRGMTEPVGTGTLTAPPLKRVLAEVDDDDLDAVRDAVLTASRLRTGGFAVPPALLIGLLAASATGFHPPSAVVAGVLALLGSSLFTVPWFGRRWLNAAFRRAGIDPSLGHQIWREIALQWRNEVPRDEWLAGLRERALLLRPDGTRPTTATYGRPALPNGKP